MNNNKLNILFVLDKVNTNTKGKSPLRCRLTYLGQRKVFSIGLFVNPKYWDSKQQKTKSPNEENIFLNSQLSLIKQEINQAFLFLQVSNKDFEVNDIYHKYKGDDITNEKSIMQLFTSHNEKVQKLVGKDYSKATFRKYEQAKDHLKDFIKHHYKRSDYQFKKLDLKFLLDYEFYLKTEKQLGLPTVNKTIQRFRKIVRIAISEGIIQREPFMLYRMKSVKKEVIYLTTEELSKLENYHFKAERLQMVADMFIFCCYTGLAYNEMANLEEKHIIKGFDGNDWIKMIREKTQKQISIPLLPKSSEILAKYHEKVKNNKLLPALSNQKFNAYLKEIADIVGIDKNLTHHIARKTFATTVLLYNDVPMEIVSELLGHSKISVTQEHYAKVVQKKVSEQMQELSKKLK